MITIQFDNRLLIKSLSKDIHAEKSNGFSITFQVPAGKSVNHILKDLNIKISQAVQVYFGEMGCGSLGVPSAES